MLIVAIAITFALVTIAAYYSGVQDERDRIELEHRRAEWADEMDEAVARITRGEQP